AAPAVIRFISANPAREAGCPTTRSAWVGRRSPMRSWRWSASRLLASTVWPARRPSGSSGFETPRDPTRPGRSGGDVDDRAGQSDPKIPGGTTMGGRRSTEGGHFHVRHDVTARNMGDCGEKVGRGGRPGETV